MTPIHATNPFDGVVSCENEQICIPGYIQPHGMLLALDPETLVIVQASENSSAFVGYDTDALLGMSPAVLVGDAQFKILETAFRTASFETGFCDTTAGVDLRPMECVYSKSNGSLLIEFTPDVEEHPLDLIDVSLTLQAPLSRMERTTSIDHLLRVVAAEIRKASGFDRVMVYRFDDDWHGVVLAEDVSNRLPVAYLGMHFPASDIPPQARDLYLLNTLRLIPDIEYVPVPIVNGPRIRSTLDLSRSELRSASPVHLQYLRNIDVRATLTISIIVHGRLWGLVACHHSTPRRINHAVRSTCNFIAQMLALKLTARIDHAGLSQRLGASESLAKFVADLQSTRSLFDALAQNWHHLLPIFQADALYVRTPDGSTVHGSSLAAADFEPAVKVLHERAIDGICASSALHKSVPEAQRFAAQVSGVLYLSLSPSGDHCIAILRREQRASVTWAGNPAKSTSIDAATGYLSPRASFAAWEEITHGESQRWSSGDLENAANLRSQLTHWQHAREEICLLAHYDALTELPNRRLIEELLKRAIADGKAQSRLVGVLFIDVDRFKRFNDRLGHSMGDRVLRSVASRISRTVRESDIVGRLGGDEFVVIMPSLTDSSMSEKIAQRLLDDVSRPLPGLDGPDLQVTLSIGISHYPADGDTGETLMSSADAAMYSVKKNGRSAWESTDSARLRRKDDMSGRTERVTEALERGEIIAHFQPIIELASGKIVAFEALARWNHPENGILGPAAFIEIAEESDLIVRLGSTMLDLSCRQLREWRSGGATAMRVAVNVSPRQLRDFAFVETVRTTLERHQLPPDALELEITEGMMIGDTSQSISALRELAESGVRIAIDDFGTGYSSFNYLRKLPVKSLKIDQSFVAELISPQTCESGSAIVLAIVSVALSLRLEVIGEGVETQEQLNILRDLGCHWAQGYFIGRPMPADAYAAILRAAGTGAFVLGSPALR